MEVNSGNIQKVLDESPRIKFEFDSLNFSEKFELSLNRVQQHIHFSNCIFNGVHFDLTHSRCSLAFSNCTFNFECQIINNCEYGKLDFDTQNSNSFHGRFVVIANRPLDQLFLRNQVFRDLLIEINGKIDTLSITNSIKQNDTINAISLFGCGASKVMINFLRLSSLIVENSQIDLFRVDSIGSPLDVKITNVALHSVLFSNFKFSSIRFEGNNKVTNDFVFERLSYQSFELIEGALINIEISNTSFMCKSRFVYIQSPTIFISQCTFSGPLYFDNIRSPRFDLHATSIEGDVFIKDVIFGKSSVETFTILKSKYINQNDRVNELIFRKEEFEALLRNSIANQKFYDTTILLLSKISNSYGTKWQVGILFTLIVSLLFYFLYIYLLDDAAPFSLGYTNWQSFVCASDIGSTYYFKFLDITHDTNFITQKPISIWANLVDFLGRIFIAFGFYQTIQAFRKFGKDNQ